MAKDVNSIEAALEAAAEASPETESSTETVQAAETEVETPEKETESNKGKGAQDRIRELVTVRDGLQEKLDQINSTVTERDSEIGKLVDLLQMREQDSQTLEHIRNLHGDDRYKDLVETLDKALKGEEIEAPKSTDKEGEEAPKEDVKGLLQAAKAELESEIKDQTAELLLHKADLLTDKYVAELPDTYNESDLNVLRTVLVDHIDWNSIEKSPDLLPEQVAKGFQSALDWYGSPKGTQPEVSETTTKEVEPELTEESLRDYIAGKDWSKMTTVKTPDGKELTVPELSEEDWTQELGNALKAANHIANR